MTTNGKPTNLVVYGALCTWWDTIDKIGRRFMVDDHALPCCPHCAGVLFQMEEKAWNNRVKEYDKKHRGYESFTIWRRGMCHPTLKAAAEAYTKETGLVSGLES